MAGFTNAAEIGADGWTIIPYGEWPHSQGIQQFAREQADAIVDNFKSGWARFKRAVIGLPVFKGHPDLRGLENEYPDKREYGQIADMEARPEGLAIKQVLSAAGAALVEAGHRFISPHWLANEVGERNGVKIYKPVLMKSVGLTNRPNIPNKSLVNTADADSKSMNKDLWLALILTLGLKPLSNSAEATAEQVEGHVKSEIDAMKTRPTAETLANERTTVLTLTQRAEKAEAELKTTKTSLTEAATALANAQAAKVDDLLAGSIRAGVITEAQKPIWKTRLERDFAGESVALVNSNPAIKTKPTVEQLRLAEVDRKIKAGLVNDDGTGGGDTPTIDALVNEEMSKPGCAAIKDPNKRRDTAFANAAKRFPQLFAPAQHA